MEFRLSTWNCFGQSQGVGAVMARRAPAAWRLAHADVLSQAAAADILCVQELMSGDALRFFDTLGAASFGSRFRDHNRAQLRTATVRGSGLGICARAALQQPRVHHFRDAGVSWDRLARKGTLHAQVTLAEGLVVDVLTTHLQAGHDPRALRVRAAQLADVGRQVAALGSPDRPFIVCGDLNIDGLEPARGGAEYRLLRATLPGFEDLGAAHDLPTFLPRPDGNTLAHRFEPDGQAQRLDYVLFRPARGARGVGATALGRLFDRPLPRTTRTGGTTWASDHYGLTATFEW